MDRDKRQCRQYLDDALARAQRVGAASERRSWLTIAASWALLLGIELQRHELEQEDEDKKSGLGPGGRSYRSRSCRLRREARCGASGTRLSGRARDSAIRFAAARLSSDSW